MTDENTPLENEDEDLDIDLEDEDLDLEDEDLEDEGEDSDDEDEDEDDDEEGDDEDEFLVSAGTSYDGPADEAGNSPTVSATLRFDHGKNIQDAVEKYGEEAVYERWKRGVRKDFGNAMRSLLRKLLGDNISVTEIPDRVAAELSNWRPDVSRRRERAAKDPFAAILQNFGSLDEERQAEIIAQLTAKAQGEG